MEVVHTAATEVEAVMLRGLLEEARIPVALNRRPVSGLSGLFQLGYTEVPAATEFQLIVPDHRAAEAREIISDYLASLEEETPS